MSAAARALNLSQPAVSTALRRMEDVVGRPLFDRVAGRLVPSVEAGRILAEVGPLYDALDRLAGGIHAIARGEGATFRLGATPSVAGTLVPRALARLRAAHPDLRVEYETPALDRVVPYLLLGQGECVASIARVEHPSLIAEEMRDVIARMERRHFRKSMTSHADHRRRDTGCCT